MIAILLVAVLMAVAGCAGGKEEDQGVAQDPTESAAASSPVPTEPPPNLINTADAPTLSTSTATTNAPTPTSTVITDAPTTAPTATNAPIPTESAPTAIPAGPTESARGLIVFSSYTQGILVINADGTGMTQLATGDVTEPAWSPDGSKIVFVHGSTIGEIRRGIFVMNADGSGQTRLKDAPLTSSFGMAWSPDGAKIAFTAGLAIYLINADGIGLTQLTPPGQLSQSPTWSPDGSKIAFSLYGRDETPIYVMNADGSGQTRITDDSIVQTWVPAWSPDGSKIAFAGMPPRSGRDSQTFLYIMNVDGSGLTHSQRATQ